MVSPAARTKRCRLNKNFDARSGQRRRICSIARHLGKLVAEHFNLSVGPLDCPQQLVRNLSKTKQRNFPVRHGLRESQGAQVNEQR